MSRTMLLAAIARARLDTDTGVGLLAQRRVLHDKDEWHVAFDRRADRHMMVILDDADMREETDEAIADLILGCWDASWDDILSAAPVGDYRLGSSDFTPRATLKGDV